MNSEELVVEVYRDLEVVNCKANYLTQGLRRQAIKSKEKYVQQLFDYKSPRHNQWFIVADHYVKDPYFTVVALYTNHFGLNGILVDRDQRTLLHITSHFLDRYNERFLKITVASHLELLKRFIPANSVQTIMSSHKNDSTKKQTFGRFHEGVGLGYKESFPERGKVLYHFNTFISNEMVLRHQFEDYNTLGKLYDGLQEEGYVRKRRCA
jgi:hypothetical protein